MNRGRFFLALGCSASLWASTAQAFCLPCVCTPCPTLWIWGDGLPPCDSMLQNCIDLAAPGDEVRIDTNGPIVESISFRKALTLKAATGFAPVFSSGQTIDAATSATGNQTIHIEGLTLQHGTIQVTQASSGTATIEILNNTIGSADFGIVISAAAATGQLSFLVSGNTATLPLGSSGIDLNDVGSFSASGSITGNTIVAQRESTNAIVVSNRDQPLSVDVIANHISGTGYSSGVTLSQFGVGTMMARVLNNLVTGQHTDPETPGALVARVHNGTLQFTISNNTVAGNDEGIGIEGQGVVMGNVANNAITGSGLAGLHIDPAFAATVNDHHNLFFGNAVDFEEGGTPVKPGAGSLFADPLYAGPGDFRLMAGSPAIDAGDDDAVPSNVHTDLDGNPRIRGSQVDIGAYEAVPEPAGVLGASVTLLALAALALRRR